ncbi:hypothetical protein HDU88_008740 [Geranomyces variabilis]|nr:hypothetical protein HDU88_008740 [Geranomyces variabilis]
MLADTPSASTPRAAQAPSQNPPEQAVADVKGLMTDIVRLNHSVSADPNLGSVNKEQLIRNYVDVSRDLLSAVEKLEKLRLAERARGKVLYDKQSAHDSTKWQAKIDKVTSERDTLRDQLRQQTAAFSAAQETLDGVTFKYDELRRQLEVSAAALICVTSEKNELLDKTLDIPAAELTGILAAPASARLFDHDNELQIALAKSAALEQELTSAHEEICALNISNAALDNDCTATEKFLIHRLKRSRR